MQKWVPKYPTTPKLVMENHAISPKNLVVPVGHDHEVGWLATTNIAKRLVNKSLMLSGLAKGFKLLVRDNECIDEEVASVLGCDVVT